MNPTKFFKCLFVIFVLLVLSSVVFAKVTESDVDKAIGESNLLLKYLIETAISTDELDDIHSYIETADEDNAAVGISSNLKALWDAKYKELAAKEGKNNQSGILHSVGDGYSLLEWWQWLLLAVALLLGIWLFIRMRRRHPHTPDQDENLVETDEHKIEVMEDELHRLWELKRRLVERNIEEARLLIDDIPHAVERDHDASIAEDIARNDAALRPTGSVLKNWWKNKFGKK